MKANLVVLPVLLPVVTAGVLLILGRASRSRRVLASISAAAQLALAIYFIHFTLIAPGLGNDASRSGGLLGLVVGGWPARFGIALVVDGLSSIMLTLSAVIVLMSMAFGFITTSADREHPLRLPLVQFLAAGIHLAFITGDLFNLFVAFEVMLLASYALLTAEADDHDITQAVPYVMLNLFGSTVFLIAAGYCYSLFGTLNFAAMAERWSAMGPAPEMTMLAVLLMIVFGIKSGLFPLYYWLPSTYPVLPSAVSALYAGMLTKVGVYAFLRLFGTIVPAGHTELYTILAYMAGATMLFGVLGAVSRNGMRGILSFHIISQIGFMLFAVGIFTRLAVTAAIFYIVHHIIVKSTLFLSAGIVSTINRTDTLSKMGGLWKRAPWVGIVFLLQALSLAGIPPLSGFWGKYLIIVEGFSTEHYFLVGVSIVASVLTLYSMLKIWNAAFWNENPAADIRLDDGRWKTMTAAAGVLVLCSLSIGLGAEFFFKLASAAASDLLNRAEYIQAVSSAMESTSAEIAELGRFAR